MMKIIWMISIILVIIGGVNWGLVAINPDYNLVEIISMKNKMFERLIYSIVSIAALTLIFIMAYYRFHSPSDIVCNKWRNDSVNKWNKKCSSRSGLSGPPQWK